MAGRFPVDGVELTQLLVVSHKPGVTFAPPDEPDPVSHQLTMRVPDCRAAYETLRSRGAHFLTPPHQRPGEIRCFFRDPDGHLLEISEST